MAAFPSRAMTESVMVMRRAAQRLSGKISLTEEIVRSKNCDNCFLLKLRNDGDLHFAFLDVEDGIASIPL
jgi:hypothetical protein